MTHKISWRCKPCWKINSGACSFCPNCGGAWKKIYDPDYVDPQSYAGLPNTEPSYHSWDEWQGWESPWKGASARGHTPRQQRPASPHGRHNKGKNKGKGKSKKDSGKGTGDKSKGKKPSHQPALPPEPAPAWKTNTSVTPKESQTPRQLTVAEQRLQELTEALQEDSAALSTRVQSILAEQAQKSEQETAQEELQELQGAASKVYQAKKQLSAARLARQALHQTWNVHIADSLARWRGYAAEFQEQDKSIALQIDEATTALTTAQQKLDEAKESKTETVDISDTEVTEKPGAATAIMEGMTEMVRSFEAIQKRTEAFALEPPIKRHKGELGEETHAAPPPGKLGLGALEPFGSAKKPTV